MSRDALIVGINTYQQLQPLQAPAVDAEAIAQRLEQLGGFRVLRLPEFLDPFEDDARRMAHNAEVTLEQLESALVRLFKPTGKHLPETALLFFSGHGLRKDRGIQEGFLATSDVNPAVGNWGLSLQWLRRLLQESEVRQQVIWLDCCYSGELLNFEEVDPGDRGRGRDRCFISASREYEVAFESTTGQYSLLTEALLAGLDPKTRADGVITNFSLTEFIQQSPTLRAASQQPLFANSGGKILLTGNARFTPSQIRSGVCPYRGLAYFDCNDDDPLYFHGRTTLTDALLEKLREGNFLAVLGASGSGKSSVMRAGLVHQLKLGQRLSGSQDWAIHLVRPGAHPLQSLALAFLQPDASSIDRATQLAKIEQLLSTGAIGLAQLAQATPHRLVLVIDQLEEVFTVCQEELERQRFFACLLGALEQASQKLCLVVGMRADFFSKCLEQDYSGLAQKIQAHLVTVSPMTAEELQQAIVEPARQVGLEVESELVTQILTDVKQSPGSLPLLQYTLTELWKQRSMNWLTLASYNQLGGVQGTLQQRADAVYAALSAEEQAIAKHIFLALTQLGEGTEDTRRQVAKQDLLTPTYAAQDIDRVITTLAGERLIVTAQLLAKSGTGDRVDVVDVAHEALIRHWPQLRQWIEDNRLLLKQQRDLEAAAAVWRDRGKPKDVAYLLQGRKLQEAEIFVATTGTTVSLSVLAQELLRSSQRSRQWSRVRLGGSLAAGLLILLTAGGLTWYQQTQRRLTEIMRDTSLNRVRPELLPIAAELQQEADRLAAAGKVDEALNNYRVILTFTQLLQAKAAQSGTKINQKLLQKTTADAETALLHLIREKRLPQLAKELSQQKFGTRKLTYDLRDFEQRYSPGALRTTYLLLNRELGVKADWNDDGQINTKAEADRMPCELLKDIEELWRKATQGRCGWYSQTKGVYDAYDAPACRLLQKQTLTERIFNDPYDSVVERLNSCKISPKPLEP
ncbi:caspase family protein [Alkalinema pantanalense CENA528]|uniref:nSTAND1 domain-containing NTPase n=1 Tax=Alkalinema pantanalense TaxID=1620705 RepID=UPI003D6EA8A7